MIAARAVLAQHGGRARAAWGGIAARAASSSSASSSSTAAEPAAAAGAGTGAGARPPPPPPPSDVRNFRSKQHCAKEWWDGVVPPWSSAKYVGRRELRGEATGAASLGLEAFYHMRVVERAAGAAEAARGEPGSAFAIVEVGAQQFKVTPDDLIYVERLQGVDVNDLVRFGRVLMSGSASRTVVGRPYIRGASVVAVVEEQFRDGKVFVFKKKRRKNYRRFNTHRQDLTGLRILRLDLESTSA